MSNVQDNWLTSVMNQIQHFVHGVHSVQEVMNQIQLSGNEPDSKILQLKRLLAEKREETKELELSISKKMQILRAHEEKISSADEDDLLQLQKAKINLFISKFEQISSYWKQLYRNSFTNLSSPSKVDPKPNIKETNQKPKEPPIEQKRERRHSAITLVPSKGFEDERSSEFEDVQLDNGNRFQKVMEVNYISKDQVLQEIVIQRNKEVSQIKRDMEELCELFKTTAKMITEGQEQLDLIEHNVQQTVTQSDQSVHDIAEASRSSNALWPTMSGVALGGAIGAGLGIFMGPLGVAIGSTTGAAVGGVFGKRVEDIRGIIIDKEMFQHEMSKSSNWVPDEDVSECPLCTQPFNQILRKHHCRACGGVFCAYCSGKKLPFKFRGMQKERMERVCDTCYKAHWSD